MLDIKGYSLKEWVDNGIIGWDLGSYFILLDTDSEELPWQLGLPPDRILTFDHLCKVINRIFGCKDGVFQFSNTIEMDYR